MLPRARLDVEAALDAVRPVCEDVRLRGAAAVREQTRRFDGVDLPSTRVPRQALADALAELSPDVRAALQEAARRARDAGLSEVWIDPGIGFGKTGPASTCRAGWSRTRPRWS